MTGVMAVIIAVIVAELVFLCVKGTDKGTPKKEVSALKVSGTALLNAEGDTVVFHGLSYGWHNIWPRFYNAASLKTFHQEWGCNIFRAAIGADDSALSDNPNAIRGYIGEPERALECLYALVDAAIENDCYIIVDWHSHFLHPEQAEEFFTKVATKYKGVPNVIYELFNEPVCFSFENGAENPYEDLGSPEAMTEYWKALKAYGERMIAAITAIDPSHPLILMGCPSWDQRIDLPSCDPIEGYDNLMYTVHFYAATHKEELRAASDYALSKGLPIFISECAACEASGDGCLDEESWAQWNAWTAERNISMISWSISDKVETCSMLVPGASAEGPWADEDIKPWGQMVKDWL